MRAKVPTNQKSKTRGVSLKPETKKFAEQMGHKSGWGFSGFVAALVEYARDNELLPKLVAHKMGKSK